MARYEENIILIASAYEGFVFFLPAFIGMGHPLNVINYLIYVNLILPYYTHRRKMFSIT